MCHTFYRKNKIESFITYSRWNEKWQGLFIGGPGDSENGHREVFEFILVEGIERQNFKKNQQTANKFRKSVQSQRIKR